LKRKEEREQEENETPGVQREWPCPRCVPLLSPLRNAKKKKKGAKGRAGKNEREQEERLRYDSILTLAPRWPSWASTSCWPVRKEKKRERGTREGKKEKGEQAPFFLRLRNVATILGVCFNFVLIGQKEKKKGKEGRKVY